MSDKKSKSGTQSTAITQTDLSITGATGMEIDDLLGEAEIGQSDEPNALLRLSPAKLNPDLRKRLGVSVSDNELIRVGSHPVILGPLAVDHIHSLAVVGAVGSKDQILLPNDRWRALVDVYPDLRGLILEGDEITHTATETMTETMQENTSSLESSEAPLSLEIEKDDAPPERAKVQPSVSSARPRSQERKRVAVSKRSRSKQSLPFDPRYALGGVGVLLLLLFWVYPNFMATTETKVDSLPESFRRVMDEERIRKLPPNLRPLNTTALHQNDDALMRKIRPFLETYEKGSIYFGEQDLRIIRGVANPASSSFRARVVASNLLLSYNLSRARYREAEMVINPILIAAPTDVDTLINASILAYDSKDFSKAREYAVSAQRLCRAPMCWVPYSILGLIAAKNGRVRQSNLFFQNALATFPNTLVTGMWLHALTDAAVNPKEGLLRVLDRSMWLDPDRHLDSPLRAPLALHWIYSQSTDGYRSALTLVGSQMSPGKRSYIQWLLGRNPFVPAMESIETVAQLLAKEDDVQAQVLHAYALKERGVFDRSSQVMNRVIPLLDYESIQSSWPWTLAGNVHEEREMLDQAILNYQAAVSRNPRDVNAVYGLAISLRDKEDFTGALEKTAEALRLDPTYIPALLRLRRLEWHRQWLQE